MKSLSNGVHTAEEMDRILHGNRSISFRYDLLDKDEHLLGAVSASGSIDFNSEAEIMGMASLSMKEIRDIDYINERIKPYMRVWAGTEWVDYPLGVYLISSPARKGGNGKVNRDCECYDKSVILNEDKLIERLRIVQGSLYTDKITEIINSAGIINTDITASALTVAQDIEFAAGTSKLAAINQLLKSINYNNLHFNENGIAVSRPYINPNERTVEYSYLTDKKSIVYSGASETLDVFSAPNKFVRYLETPEREEIRSVYTNDDPASILSTVSRGRVIVDIDKVTDIADQTTLNSYTERIALENQIYKKLVFQSALMPHHDYLDCLYIDNQELSLSGKYIETGWTMELIVGGYMTHTLRRAVPI